MAGQRRLIFLLVISFGSLTKTAANVNIDAEPKTLTPGITSTLTINCTFSFKYPLYYSSIKSLMISKTEVDINKPRSFKDYASVNTLSLGQVTQHSKLNASASSHIEAHEDSYLSLTWSYPLSREAGIYKCEAFVEDYSGHHLFISETVPVISKQTQQSQLVEEVRSIRFQFEDVKKIVLSNISSLTTELAAYENFIEVINKRLESSKTALFEISPVYDNRRYYMSKYNFNNVYTSEALCEMYGGYLTEIDDEDEHDFIKLFIDNYGDIEAVLLGSTQEGKKQHWRFRYSNKPVLYFKWAEGEPDGGNFHDSDCMALYAHSEWDMAVWRCDNAYFEYSSRLLCEVPNTD